MLGWKVVDLRRGEDREGREGEDGIELTERGSEERVCSDYTLGVCGVGSVCWEGWMRMIVESARNAGARKNRNPIHPIATH